MEKITRETKINIKSSPAPLKNMGLSEMFFNIIKQNINNLSRVNHRKRRIRGRTGDTKMAIVVILIFSVSGNRHGEFFRPFLLILKNKLFPFYVLWFSIIVLLFVFKRFKDFVGQ